MQKQPLSDYVSSTMKTKANIKINLDDVTTVDAIIKALYGSISFPQGGSPELERLRPLWIPDGRLLIPKRDQPDSNSMTVDDFIERCKVVFASDRFRGKGFRETETKRQEQRFGNILHVFSAYVGVISDPEERVIGRGINSIQLLWENERWWIVSMVWDDERPENPMLDWAE